MLDQYFMEKCNLKSEKRDLFFDFFRGTLMLFIFWHHIMAAFPNAKDLAYYFNAAAELFVGLSGFMVGFIYLRRNKDYKLFRKGIKIFAVYYFVSIIMSILYKYSMQTEITLSQTLINTILMMEDHTWISILRIYGIIFILSPLILFLARKSSIITFLGSLATFIFTMIIHSLLNFENFFIVQTVLVVLEWQIFFIIGLLLGDLYRDKKLKKNYLIKISLLLAFVGLVLHIFWLGNTSLEKYPYTIGKVVNILYVAPIWAFTIHIIYNKAKSTFPDRYIRVLGRNSLVAFVIADFVRAGICVGSRIINNYFEYNIFLSFLISLVFSLGLVIVIWAYEKIKHDIQSYVGYKV